MRNAATLTVNLTGGGEMPRWITAKDAAKLLGVHPNRITRLIKEGRLEARPNPLDRRSKIVDRDQVEALLALKPEPLDENED